MFVQRAIVVISFFAAAAGAACSDAASSPARPSFGVSAADTLPGGCTDHVCQFKASGSSAFVSWTTQLSGATTSDTGGGGGGGTIQYGSADVSRGGQQTFFSYGVTECSPFFCNQVAGGFGVIPTSDFDTKGSSYRVSTNTAGNVNFFTFAGSPGAVTIEWVANGLFSQRFNGTMRTTQPGFSEQQTGQSDYQSASATGNVVGFTIGAGGSAQISSSRDVRITITR